MKYGLLGNTGIRVSQLCMGTMTFGREADKSASEAIFKRCLDSGINFFDCANVYGDGIAETILGELIADHRQQLIITTKCGSPFGSEIHSQGGSRRNIIQSIEASLKRLKTDYVDIFFLHKFDNYTPLEVSLRALNDMVAQGKVRYLGVSNFSAWQTMKACGLATQHDWAPIDCIQPMYNLVKRQAEVEILPMAKAENLGVITYSPIGAGLLAGKYGKVHTTGEGRLTTDHRYQKRYRDRWMFDAAKHFYAFAMEAGYHPVSLAVAWVSRNKAVTAPIIGARSVKQLEDCLRAVEIDLTDQLYDAISEITPTPPTATDRSEEQIKVDNNSI
ncbi:MAG: aldo/keto reductase [Deltaproteobacteria bacterium]|nr:aldo/keto reductase [Deltaproteobacteria bacterium]